MPVYSVFPKMTKNVNKAPMKLLNLSLKESWPELSSEKKNLIIIQLSPSESNLNFYFRPLHSLTLL